MRIFGYKRSNPSSTGPPGRHFRGKDHGSIRRLAKSNQISSFCLPGDELFSTLREENLSAYEVRLESTRAEANEEGNDTSYWDNRYREREKEMRDPDDLFFGARDRKQEIKEQIRELPTAFGTREKAGWEK